MMAHCIQSMIRTTQVVKKVRVSRVGGGYKIVRAKERQSNRQSKIGQSHGRSGKVYISLSTSEYPQCSGLGSTDSRVSATSSLLAPEVVVSNISFCSSWEDVTLLSVEVGGSTSGELFEETSAD